MEEISKIFSKVMRKAKEIEISSEELAGMIDHTDLSPYTKENTIEKLCEEAKTYGFHSVAIHPYYTEFCSKNLSEEKTVIDPVIGFPLGQNTPEVKVFETKKAREDGAEEVDMVMNIGAFRDGKYDFVKEEIRKVVEAAGNCPVKVILETGYLTYEEIEKACKIVKESGADFVKNSTGFGPYGANIPHLYLMRESVGKNFGVKAAGGIGNARDALLMIGAGADRIGASSGVEIVESFDSVNVNKLDFGESECSFCPSEMVSRDEVPEDVYDYYELKCENC